MQLILVRHGLPEAVDNSDGAHADPALTPQGHAQAERLVGALTGEPVDAIYASPLRRAAETAAPLAAARELDVRTRDGLTEYDSERSIYVPVDQVASADPEAWARMRAGYLPAHVDAAEFAQRVTGAVEQIVAAHAGRSTAVVVAHAGVLNAYLTTILRSAYTLPFPVDYVGICRVLCARDGIRKVRTVNELTHVADLL